MNINYNIDHKLLSITEMDNFKNGQERTLALILLSMIIHFTKNVGHLDYYQAQLASDFGCNPQRLANILNKFKGLGWVKETRKYQRNGNIPARIVATNAIKRYIPDTQKVYTDQSKGIYPRVTVKNYYNNSKGGDVSNEHPSLEKESTHKNMPDLNSPEWLAWADNQLKKQQ